MVNICHRVTCRTSVRGAERTSSQPGGAVGMHAWMPPRSKLARGSRAVHLQIIARNSVEGEFRCHLKLQSAVILLVEPYQCLPEINSGALPWFNGGNCRQMASFVQSTPW